MSDEFSALEAPHHDEFTALEKPAPAPAAARPVDQPSSDEAEPIPTFGGIANAGSEALNLPGRGIQALDVLARQPGDLSARLGRAAEVAQPGFKPEEGKTNPSLISRFIGDMPKYTALGAALGPIATAPVVAGSEALAKAVPAIAQGVKAVTPFFSSMSVGAGINGVAGAMDDMAAKGQVDPKDVRNSMVWGALTAGGLHMGTDAAIEYLMSDAGRSMVGTQKIFMDRVRAELVDLRAAYHKQMGTSEVLPKDAPLPSGIVDAGKYVPQDLQEEVIRGTKDVDQATEEAGERFKNDLQHQGAVIAHDPAARVEIAQDVEKAMTGSGLPPGQAQASVTAALHQSAVHAENVQAPQMTAPPAGSLPPAAAEPAPPAAPEQKHPIEAVSANGKKYYELTLHEFTQEALDKDPHTPMEQIEAGYHGVGQMAVERGLKGPAADYFKASLPAASSSESGAGEVPVSGPAGASSPTPPLSAGESVPSVPAGEQQGQASPGAVSSFDSLTGQAGEVKPPEMLIAEAEKVFQRHLEEGGGLNAATRSDLEAMGPEQVNAMRDDLTAAVAKSEAAGHEAPAEATKAIKELTDQLDKMQADHDAVMGAADAATHHPLRPFADTARGMLEFHRIDPKYEHDKNYSNDIKELIKLTHRNRILGKDGKAPGTLAEMAHSTGDTENDTWSAFVTRAKQQFADGDTKGKHDRVLARKDDYAAAFGAGKPPEPPAPPAPPSGASGEPPANRPESQPPTNVKAAAASITNRAPGGPVTQARSEEKAKAAYTIAELNAIHQSELARAKALAERAKTDAKVAAQMASNEKLQLREKARAAEKDLIDGFQAKLVEVMDSNSYDAAEAKVRGDWQAAIQNKIVDYVRQYIPTQAQGKFLTMIRDTKTPLAWGRAFTKIKEASIDFHKRALIKDIQKVQDRALESGSVDVNIKNAVKADRDSVAWHGFSPEKMERLTATEQYINHAKANGQEVNVPQSILDDIKQLNTRSSKDLSESELEGMLARAHYLEDKGRFMKQLKDEIRQFGMDIKKAEIIRDAVPLDKHPQVVRKPGSFDALGTKTKINNMVGKAQDVLQRINVATTPMLPFMDMLSGGGYNKGVVKHIWDPVVSDLRRATIMHDDAVIASRAEIARLKLETPNLERINAWLTDRQENGQGHQHLLDSDWTEQQLKDLKLTPAEKEMADYYRRAIDKHTAKLVQTHRDLNNEELKLHQNYWPIQSKGGAPGASILSGDDFDMQNASPKDFMTKTFNQGFTEERKPGAGGRINNNAQEVFERADRRMTAFTEQQDNVNKSFEIINSPEVKKALGDVGQDGVLQWLSSIARDGHGANDPLSGTLGWLRRNVGDAALSLKLNLIALHYVKVISGGAETSARYLTRGIMAAAFDDKANALMDKNADIRMGQGLAPEQNYGEPVNNAMSKFKTWSFKFMQEANNQSQRGAYWAAYLQNLEDRGVPLDYDKADPVADAVATRKMNLTQSSGLSHEIPAALSRGALTGSAEVDKALLQFGNPKLTTWSYLKHDAIAAGWKEGGDKAEAVRKLMWIGAAQAAQAGVRWGTRGLIMGILGGGGIMAMSAEEKLDDYAKEFLSDTLSLPPFVPNFLSVAKYHQSPIPVLQPGVDLGLAVGHAIFGKGNMTRAQTNKDIAVSIAALASMLGVPSTGQISEGIRDSMKKSAASAGGYSGYGKGYGGYEGYK